MTRKTKKLIYNIFACILLLGASSSRRGHRTYIACCSIGLCEIHGGIR